MGRKRRHWWCCWQKIESTDDEMQIRRTKQCISLLCALYSSVITFSPSCFFPFPNYSLRSINLLCSSDKSIKCRRFGVLAFMIFFLSALSLPTSWLACFIYLHQWNFISCLYYIYAVSDLGLCFCSCLSSKLAHTFCSLNVLVSMCYKFRSKSHDKRFSVSLKFLL